MDPSRSPRAGQPFLMVVGYEDYESGHRALELYRRLTEQWQGTLDFRLAMWRFEPLGVPAVRDEAVEQAINADLVLISASGREPLPEEAWNWIKGWQSRKTEHSAVALLLDGRHHRTAAAREIENILKSSAAESGCAFFSSNPVDSPGSVLGTARRGNPPVRQGSRLKSRPEPPCDHWGIND